MYNYRTMSHPTPPRRGLLTALLLAAGESRRTAALGPKQLLPWRAGRTILQAALDNLAATELSFQEAIVVLGSHAGEIVPTLSREQWPNLPLRVAVNESWQAGMLSSVQRGLAMSAPAGGYLIMLGDQPALVPTTIHALVSAFLAAPTRPTLPTFAGKEGHPLIIPAALRAKIIAAAVNTRGGLRSLIGDDILRVEVSDPAITWDIDTVADYRQRQNDSPLLTRP